MVRREVVAPGDVAYDQARRVSVARIRWARELWDAMQPFSIGGVYANNLGEEGKQRVAAAYGETYGLIVGGSPTGGALRAIRTAR